MRGKDRVPAAPTAISLQRVMGAHLLTLKRFNMSTDLICKRVLADGQTNTGGIATALQHVYFAR